MEPITAQQFLENAKAWEPKADFAAMVETRLVSGRTPEPFVKEFTGAFFDHAWATYNYIQYINQLAATQQLDRSNFIAQVAHMVELVRGVQEQSLRFQGIFQRYDEKIRPLLVSDRFDTLYFDAIQGMDIPDMLKKVTDEVELILQSFSLVANDLSGIKCVELYENSVRFHLFLQYLLNKKKFSLEELWSLLFDFNTQASQMQAVGTIPTAEELMDLQDKILKYRTN